MAHKTNFADLVMGNAIRRYLKENDVDGEVGPHIREGYELPAATPAGKLRCEVWQEFDMSTGSPRPVWAAEFWLDGKPAEAYRLKDLGLAGQIEAQESPGNVFAQWLAVRVRVRKEHRRVIDWPTARDLHEDMAAWALRRGTPPAALPSLKAFSSRMKEVEGVEADRAARGVHMKYVELIERDRPAAPEVVVGETQPPKFEVYTPPTYAEQQARAVKEAERVRKIKEAF